MLHGRLPSAGCRVLFAVGMRLRRLGLQRWNLPNGRRIRRSPGASHRAEWTDHVPAGTELLAVACRRPTCAGAPTDLSNSSPDFSMACMITASLRATATVLSKQAHLVDRRGARIAASSPGQSQERLAIVKNSPDWRPEMRSFFVKWGCFDSTFHGPEEHSPGHRRQDRQGGADGLRGQRMGTTRSLDPPELAASAERDHPRRRRGRAKWTGGWRNVRSAPLPRQGGARSIRVVAQSPRLLVDTVSHPTERSRRALQYFTLRVKPPSTVRLTPVIHDARGEARKSTALAISSGLPKRPAGCLSRFAS